MKRKKKVDILIIGAGHNGLVASIFLARQGLDVLALESASQVGGAVKTEYPFLKAPELGVSSGAYLLGLMPPELPKKIGIHIPLIRRDPHYFLPTFDQRYLLLGSKQDELRHQFLEFFSEEDWVAHQNLNDEIGKMRDDLAPSWLQHPLSVEETAERFLRPELRETFKLLVRRPVEEYLSRFGFKSELLQAMYAVTDSFSGLNACFGTAGAGFNFLVHNMCRLPGSGGTWMIVRGGMGTISELLAQAAIKAGVTIYTHSKVNKILTTQNKATGALLANGLEIEANIVLSNADPFHTLDLVGQENVPLDFWNRIAKLKRDGTTMKINLALKGLPKFKCLDEIKGQHSTTIHLLPQNEGSIFKEIQNSYLNVQRGLLADFPTIEWYIHTVADPSLQDKEGNHNSAFFVQWVPYELSNSTWEKEESRYVQHILSIADRFAPGTSDLVLDTFVLTPPKIEKHFGITRGHIHHVDNTFAMDQRMPYQTPIQGLFSCSAGCHPAGSVIGAAGYNAAQAIISCLY